MEEIIVITTKQADFIEITNEISLYIKNQNLQNGFVYITIPHTTAGITINENADKDVKNDILMKLSKLVDNDSDYAHFEGNSKAHIKASLMGCTLTIPVANKKLLLGTWQGIYFCEFDGPRKRKVWIHSWKSC
ncbi:MAG: secondary thiamine-phosphate synthase enzyme YjbQ [Clostridiales bacterium]|nr:secondary thiamine-phosphate synthase enzyme YjbQ [Clostridiales bacterium]